MEILFFVIAFVSLFLLETTKRLQPSQWVEVKPKLSVDWEKYEIPTYQRRNINIAKRPVAERKKQKAEVKVKAASAV